MKSIKFAIVGCGRISKNHIEALNYFQEEAQIVAVCDPNLECLDHTVEITKAKGYQSIDLLLRNSDCDVVSLCSPSGLHPQQAILCAKFKKNVVSEKPMATSYSDGLKMVKICKEENVKLFIVKQNRKNLTIQYLKRALLEERFGKIYNISMNVFWTRPQSYYDASKWRGTWALDGGALMNQASHYIDLLQWLIGEVSEVCAFTGTLARSIEAEDSGAVILRWKNGILGTLNVTMLTYPKNLEGSVTIIGEKGTVKVGGVALNEIKVWNFNDTREYDVKALESGYKVDSVYGSGHIAFYKNVIDSINNYASPDVDGDEGLKSLELICAMYESAKQQKIIHLPLARSF